MFCNLVLKIEREEENKTKQQNKKLKQFGKRHVCRDDPYT